MHLMSGDDKCHKENENQGREAENIGQKPDALDERWLAWPL